MRLRLLFLLLVLLGSPFQVLAQTRAENLEYLATILGYQFENGQPTPEGQSQRVSNSEFAKVIREIRQAVARLDDTELAVLRAYAKRKDGSNGYFSVKVVKPSSRLRFGYRQIYVGSNRGSDVVSRLLLNRTFYEPLVGFMRQKLEADTGLRLRVDPLWQDYRRISQSIKKLSQSLSRSKTSRCLQQGTLIILSEKRYQPEFAADTGEIRQNKDGSIFVSHDRVGQMTSFLKALCHV